jgi:hypothetical protein
MHVVGLLGMTVFIYSLLACRLSSGAEHKYQMEGADPRAPLQKLPTVAAAAGDPVGGGVKGDGRRQGEGQDPGPVRRQEDEQNEPPGRSEEAVAGEGERD